MTAQHDRRHTASSIAREFLKTTGVVVVGIGVWQHRRGAGARGRQGRAAARAGIRPARSDAARFLHRDPPEQHRDAVSRLRRSRARRAHGAVQIAAEELDLDFNQISIVSNDTFVCTNGFTAASRTAGIGGTETRAAAAEARRVLLGLASERLKAPVQRSDGRQRRRVGEAARHSVRSLTPSCWAINRSIASSSRSATRRHRAATQRNTDDAPPKSPIRTTRSWARACRGPTCTTRCAAHTSTCSMSAFRACSTAAWCGRRASSRGSSNPKVASIDESSIKDIPGCANRAQAELRRRGR